jgi:Uma2 family endonuclease
MMSTKELPGNSSFLSFFGVLSIVPVTIQLPDLDSQTEFNLARWEQVLADTTLATLSYRIETDQHGHILMSPPPTPEICVEIVFPSNSRSEITEKRALYFDAGAAEVWVCALDGSISFFISPHQQLPASSICPPFPVHIP